jgi:ribose 5-phosphate isomerase A
VIGIGSGSTVPYVVERILAQGEEANRSRVFIPTGNLPVANVNLSIEVGLGFQSKQLIVDAGLRLADLDVFPEIDVTIDGADE